MSWSKYNARKTTIDGISFPSRLEADTYAHLRLLRSALEIGEIEMQQTVFLSAARIPYKTDFKCLDCTIAPIIWVEAKGIETDRWRIIKKLWKAYGPGPLHVYKRSKRGVYIAEEITPEGIEK